MRNIEQPIPEEISKNISKTETEEKKEKSPDKKLVTSSLWTRIKNAGKIATLVTLLSLPGLRELNAQEKAEKIETISKIETLIKETEEKVKKIVAIVSEKGESGTMSGVMRRIPIKRLESKADGSVIRIGYPSKDEISENNAEWLIYKNKESSRQFFDKDADGSVDRIIINKEAKLSKEAKSALNDLDTFSSMDDLAREAKFASSFSRMRKKVTVFEITKENGNYIIKTVDFNNGDTSIISGEKAEKIVSGIQDEFNQEITNLLEDLQK